MFYSDRTKERFSLKFIFSFTFFPDVIFTAGPDPDAPYNYEERLEILKNNYCSALDIVREREDIRTVVSKQSYQ